MVRMLRPTIFLSEREVARGRNIDYRDISPRDSQ